MVKIQYFYFQGPGFDPSLGNEDLASRPTRPKQEKEPIDNGLYGFRFREKY